MNTTKNTQGLTKSGFIRSLPDRMPAKEVVAKAKEVGLDLNEKFVWTIQSEMRGKMKKGPGGTRKKAGKVHKPTAAAVKRATSTGSVSPSAAGSAERRMRALIVEIGTAQADELYRAVKNELIGLAGA